jgi:hypothetical protein
MLTTPVRKRLSGRPTRIIAAPFLATGAALVAYICTGVSLPLGILGTFCAAMLVAAIVWRRLPPPARAGARARIARGAVAGVLATGAYDLCRLITVEVFGFTFWPFDIFTRFGRLLVGDSAPSVVVTVVGTAYHYTNGIGFGIAYVLFVRHPRIRTGLVWAAVLETFMVSLYPGWLDLKALDEFVSVATTGHIAYGVVLGSVSRALLTRLPAARRSDESVIPES